MTKKCKKCEQVKSLEDFSKSVGHKDGYANICKACVVLRNQEYWRTPYGRISQIRAVQTVSSKGRGHIKPTYTQNELFDWAIDNGLLTLHAAWQASGYVQDLSPSADRLDPMQGYSLNNLRLVTWKENNEKAYADRKSCKHVTKQCQRIEQLSLAGIHVAFYDSIASAARAVGAVRTNINAMCKGRPTIKSVGGYLWRYA